MNSQNICRGVVDRVWLNNSPSNIFQILLVLERYHQYCQSVLAAVCMNWLSGLINPPNIEATFVQCTRFLKNIKTLSFSYSLESSC